MPKESEEPKRYHAPFEGAPWFLGDVLKVSDQELEKLAHDPNCIEMEACARALAERLATRERHEVERQAAAAAELQRRSAARKELLDNPFDPRTEVSADARHIAGRIVKHLWIIFVLLPFVAVLLLLVAEAFK
jgi:hypothetical protein